MREKLEQAGLRVTRQRMMIADLLFAKGDRHVTAEALYAEASVIPYPPSLATIYNTLKLLVEVPGHPIIEVHVPAWRNTGQYSDSQAVDLCWSDDAQVVVEGGDGEEAGARSA